MVGLNGATTTGTRPVRRFGPHYVSSGPETEFLSTQVRLRGRGTGNLFAGSALRESPTIGESVAECSRKVLWGH